MSPILSRLASTGIINSTSGFNIGRRRPGLALGLYDFTTYTFLPIVSAGSATGPTLAQMQSAYAGTPWISSYFTLGSYQGYQRWTVPITGSYTIEAGGGMGGDGTSVYYSSISTKSYGAKIIGTFSLTSGDVLEMVIGSKGGSSGGPHGNENGGGGGTFIRNVTTNTLLLVAGGAGGVPSTSYGTYCSRTVSTGHGQSGETPGNPSGCYTSTSTASGGYGGYSAGSYQGAAGGGYLGNGANGGTHCSTAIGGQGFNNGMVGGAGNSCYNTNNAGGFGGGGGGMLGTPGAGGGYNGGSVTGAWSSYSNYGGGGGSYNVGTSQTNTAGGNTGSEGGYIGAGYCKITKV
jgi:hypothetical protein